MTSVASIVSSHPALVISVSMPTLWKLKDGGAAVLTRLAALLHIKRHTMIRETRLCTVGVSQPCWPGSPYQPIPVATARVVQGRPAGARRSAALPRGYRRDPAGDQLQPADLDEHVPDRRLPAADHRRRAGQGGPVGYRLLRRGSGRPGRAGAGVRQGTARRSWRHPAGGQRGRPGHRHAQQGQADRR